MGGLARHRIHLDQFDVSPFCHDFTETITVSCDFLLIWPCTVNPHEQALDHNRADLGRLEDIVQNLLKGDGGHIHQVIVLLGPRVELGPDLSIVLIQ